MRQKGINQEVAGADAYNFLLPLLHDHQKCSFNSILMHSSFLISLIFIIYYIYIMYHKIRLYKIYIIRLL